MTKLSPSAQAVKDAVLALYSDEKVRKFGWQLDVRTVTAVLRAAADQLTPYTVSEMTGAAFARNKLLVIAAELEAQ